MSSTEPAPEKRFYSDKTIEQYEKDIDELLENSDDEYESNDIDLENASSYHLDNLYNNNSGIFILIHI